MGAKLCRPDSDVWIIYGDGSLGYSVAEFDTFTRHKVRKMIVNNENVIIYVSIYNVIFKFPYFFLLRLAEFLVHANKTPILTMVYELT